MLNLKERDKQLHLLAGMLLAALMYPFLDHLAVAATVAIGLVKEYVVDVIWPGGYPDIWDAAATALGALLVAGFVLLARLV